MADPGGKGTLRLTALAGLLVVLLAAASLLWPSRQGDGSRGLIVVYDPAGRPDRLAHVYEPLAEVMRAAGDRPLQVRVETEVAAILRLARESEVFVFCPDAVAIRLDRDRYAPVVAGRRQAPHNLRPQGVLVYRRSAGFAPRPWRTHPERTVLGDSVSLAATGGWMLDADSPLPGGRAATGPDPYDHGPALHALRIGPFDYALVRQWDADRFLAAGLLPPAEWAVATVTPPLPDVVLMAPRSLPAARRLGLGEALTRIGRDDHASATAAQLEAGLGRLQLVGFNLLVEPDLDRMRRRLRSDWPRHAE